MENIHTAAPFLLIVFFFYAKTVLGKSQWNNLRNFLIFENHFLIFK